MGLRRIWRWLWTSSRPGPVGQTVECPRCGAATAVTAYGRRRGASRPGHPTAFPISIAEVLAACGCERSGARPALPRWRVLSRTRLRAW